MSHPFTTRQFQIQSDILSLMLAIQAADVKEYKADWLKNKKTVVRDANGRFALGGTTVFDSSTGEVVKPIKPASLPSAPSLLSTGMDTEAIASAVKTQKAKTNPKKAQKALDKIKSFNDEINEDIKIGQEIARRKRDKEAEIQTPSDLFNLYKFLVRETGKYPLLRTRKKRELLAEYKAAMGTPGGFDLEKRVKELDEIIQKEGADSLSAQWRAGVIQAELKYGDKLDALSSGGEKEYYELIESLQKKDAPKGRFEALDKKNHIIFGQYSQDMGNPILFPSEEVPSKTIQYGLKEAERLQSMLRVPMDVGYDVAASRPYAIPGIKNETSFHQIMELIESGRDLKESDVLKKKDGCINLGELQDVAMAGGESAYGYSNDSAYEDHVREMTFHETGHIYEIKMGLLDLSAQFRKDRGEETPKEVKQLDPLQRNIVQDAFLDPYVGLIYVHNNKEYATEVVSSGFESLGSAKFAKRAVQQDREMMLYAIATMEMDEPFSKEKIDAKAVLSKATAELNKPQAEAIDKVSEQMTPSERKDWAKLISKEEVGKTIDKIGETLGKLSDSAQTAFKQSWATISDSIENFAKDTKTKSLNLAERIGDMGSAIVNTVKEPEYAPIAIKAALATASVLGAGIATAAFVSTTPFWVLSIAAGVYAGAGAGLLSAYVINKTTEDFMDKFGDMLDKVNDKKSKDVPFDIQSRNAARKLEKLNKELQRATEQQAKTPAMKLKADRLLDEIDITQAELDGVESNRKAFKERLERQKRIFEESDRIREQLKKSMGFLEYLELTTKLSQELEEELSKKDSSDVSELDRMEMLDKKLEKYYQEMQEEKIRRSGEKVQEALKRSQEATQDFFEKNPDMTDEEKAALLNQRKENIKKALGRKTKADPS